MKVAVAGTGYVGLVTAVCLAEIGHTVICVDVDQEKIKMLQSLKSPIYEKNLEEFMKKNKDHIFYTLDYKKAYQEAEIIFIGVGTPERYDGSANLDYVYHVCEQIKGSVTADKTIVIKSTVPIGTNDEVEKFLNKESKIHFSVASNPEFLAQGTAVHDTLYASRIVVGTNDEKSKKIMEQLYLPLTKEPYNVPYLSMNRRSAEMVKYASNDFLALKISYINEIANFCEKVGANIDEVTRGMSYDSRIGNQFLKAGIGYGGSCFPKDTKALHWLGKSLDCELKTVNATIEINRIQKLKLAQKVKEDFPNLKGKKAAVLGLSFKPGTDDLREAPSLVNIDFLLDYGVNVSVYDPVALDKFKSSYKRKIKYCTTIDEAIQDCDFAFIMTEWKEIKEYDLNHYRKYMKTPFLYDGRNCYSIEAAKKAKIKYYSIGRPS